MRFVREPARTYDEPAPYGPGWSGPSHVIRWTRPRRGVKAPRWHLKANDSEGEPMNKRTAKKQPCRAGATRRYGAGAKHARRGFHPPGCGSGVKGAMTRPPAPYGPGWSGPRHELAMRVGALMQPGFTRRLRPGLIVGASWLANRGRGSFARSYGTPARSPTMEARALSSPITGKVTATLDSVAQDC